MQWYVVLLAIFKYSHTPYLIEERCLFWECDSWISNLCLSQPQETDDQLVEGTVQLEGKEGEATLT